MAEPAILAENVSFARGARRVLDGVSFDAERGEVLALLGPNGAGKSTLLRAVAGLLPFTGCVRLDGADVQTLPPRERARRIALVPQQTSLRSPLPVRDVVAQGRYALRSALAGLGAVDRERIARALDLTNMAALAERAFTSLSCGEQRRALVARALASDATILCLDEPAAALDVRHALELYALLRRLARAGHAVVVVLHPLDDARVHADRALLLASGACVKSGPASEVVSAGPVREVYGVELVPDAALGFALCEVRA